VFPKTGTKAEIIEFELNVLDSDVDQLPLELFDLVKQNGRNGRLSLLGGLHQGCG
jgi:hypothetical protein